ncbi:MAG: hypothetical protein KME29_14835 [Calothrix sp. FI2-JRJ7]|jgi:hypothetical protein|nr:hypothetical protein [Calothrix sp. FI2-JRJ7]
MAKKSKKSIKFDAVKGGKLSSSISGAVLGCIKGLRQPEACLDEQVSLDAMANAPNYSNARNK